MAFDIELRDPTATFNIVLSGGSTTGYIKVWDSSAWVKKPVKYWTGTTWTVKPVKYWNGSSWIPTS